MACHAWLKIIIISRDVQKPQAYLKKVKEALLELLGMIQLITYIFQTNIHQKLHQIYFKSFFRCFSIESQNTPSHRKKALYTFYDHISLFFYFLFYLSIPHSVLNRKFYIFLSICAFLQNYFYYFSPFYLWFVMICQFDNVIIM